MVTLRFDDVIGLWREGQRRLAKLGYKGFATFDERQLVEIGRWLDAAP